ncbi:MAG: cupredoxin domain-containing protein [bacterium]|nr:cupredoxin domain-containing protein [bacterium]
MTNKTILIIVVILILIVGGYFLFKGGYQAPKTESSVSGGAREIKIIGTDFAFNPSEITAKAGEKVKIIFQNNGNASHNLVVEGLGIGTKTIGFGKTDAIEFTSPTPGTYSFFCSIPGHKAAGMTGSLIIE